MENIKITTIGHSGAGKTCLLYGMYAQMAFGINGFTFLPESFDTGLLLEAGWDELVEDGKWPDNTDLPSEFIFECSYAYDRLFSFEWYDYRGGMLLEWKKSEEKKLHEEREKLFQRLRQSSSIVLVVEAELIKSMLNNDLREQKKLRIMNSILNEYKKEPSNKPIPVAVTITKADMFENKEELNNAIKLLKEKFLSSLFQEGGGWPVIVTAISLGEHLGGKQGEPLQGIIAPKNIHLPVMFTVYITIKNILKDALNEKDRLASAKREADSKYYVEVNRSGWSKLWNRDQSEEYKQNLQAITESFQMHEEKINKMSKDLSKIESEINNGCVIFINGRRVKFSNS